LTPARPHPSEAPLVAGPAGAPPPVGGAARCSRPVPRPRSHRGGAGLSPCRRGAARPVLGRVLGLAAELLGYRCHQVRCLQPAQQGCACTPGFEPPAIANSTPPRGNGDHSADTHTLTVAEMSMHDIAQAQCHAYRWSPSLPPELVYSTTGWAC
jgi:hypothetical protein